MSYRSTEDSRWISALLGLLLALGSTGCPSEENGAQKNDTTGAEDTTATSFDAAADSSTATDTGATDAPSNPAEDSGATDTQTGPGAVSFLMSGRYTGQAVVKMPGETMRETHDAVATFAETNGEFRGIIRIQSTGGEPLFEYATLGILGKHRKSIELRLSERRCPEGQMPSGCMTRSAMKETVYKTRGGFDGMRFAFGRSRTRIGVDTSKFTPALESLTLAPKSGFGADSGRYAPSGGFHPVENDGGYGTDAKTYDDIPVPSGTTKWSGKLTNAAVVGGQKNADANCELTLDNGGSELELGHLECDGKVLADAMNHPTSDPRVKDGSFAADMDHEKMWFRFDGRTRYVFVGRRYGDIISGLVAKDMSVNDSYWESDKTPISLGELSFSDVQASFYLEKE